MLSAPPGHPSLTPITQKLRERLHLFEQLFRLFIQPPKHPNFHWALCIIEPLRAQHTEYNAQMRQHPLLVRRNT